MCTECRRRDRTECCELEAPAIARSRFPSHWHSSSVDNGCWSGIGRYPAAIRGNEVCRRDERYFWRGSLWGCVVVVVLVKWCDNATFRAVVSLCYGTVKLDCCIPRVQIGLAFFCLPPTKAVVPSSTPCTIVSCVFLLLFFFAQAFVQCRKHGLLCRTVGLTLRCQRWKTLWDGAQFCCTWGVSRTLVCPPQQRLLGLLHAELRTWRLSTAASLWKFSP